MIILVVIGVEVFNERRAEKALASLRRLAEPTALVRRGGAPCDVPVEQLAPGDLLLLREGQRIPADAPSPWPGGGLKTSVYLEVEGAAHYLPAYAGNLDIMTSAARATGERLARKLALA